MTTTSQRQFWRAFWLRLHLYLALGVGFFFAIIGLSGSLSIYREAIDIFLNPQLSVPASSQPLSLDKIFAAVQAAHPNRYGSWTLELPLSPTGTVTAWFDKPQESVFEWHAPLMVAVNPYTAAVIDSRFWGSTLTTWLLDWHTQLHWDRLGWQLVGVLGGLLVISVLTGGYLWWSSLAGLGSVVKLRLRQGPRWFCYDAHRLLGILTTLMLLVLALTGIQLSYPSLLAGLTGASGMNHADTGKVIVSTADPTQHPTTLAGAVFIARSVFPDAQLRRVSTPLGDSGVYRINFRQVGEVNQRHPFSTVWVDRWSGQIKAVRNAAEFSWGERYSSWIWPLHTGEALGATGRLLWFVAGISLFGLYVSGLLLWLLRRGWIREGAINAAGLWLLPKQFLSVVAWIQRQIKVQLQTPEANHWQRFVGQILPFALLTGAKLSQFSKLMLERLRVVYTQPAWRDYCQRGVDQILTIGRRIYVALRRQKRLDKLD